MEAKKARNNKRKIVRLFSEILSNNEEREELALVEKFKALRSQDECAGVHLTEIIINSSYEPAIRQIACQYLTVYTSDSYALCSEIEADLTIKDKIMKLSIMGLKDSMDKVRNTVAYVLTKIATSDWSRYWPEISGALLECLDSGNEHVVLGAMQVVGRCICEVDSDQLNVMGEVILKKMYQIFENENYCIGVRCQLVEVLQTLVSMCLKPDFTQRYLYPMMPNFCEKFIHYLNAENDSCQKYCLIASIVETVELLTEASPKCISDIFPQILSMIWKTLGDTAKVYHKKSLFGSGGETMEHLERSVCAIVHFTGTLMEISCEETDKYSLPIRHYYYVRDSLSSEVLYHFIIFMLITDEKIQLWSYDWSKFYRDETGVDIPDSLREEVQMHLVVEHILRFPKFPTNDTLVVVILKYLESESNMRVSRSCEVSQNWWRLHEAFLLAFCITRDVIVKKQIEGSLQFNFVTFLENVILADLNDSESHPFLIARCLRVGGIYADEMQPEMASRFLESTIKELQNECLCVKICALIATKHLLRLTAIESNKEHKTTLTPQVPALFQELFNIGSQSKSLETSELVIRNVYLIALFYREFGTTVESKIYKLITTAYPYLSQSSYDTQIGRVTKYFIKQFTLNEEFRTAIQTYVVPLFTGETFDVLDILVKHSPQPLSGPLINNAFPATCQLILNSSSNTVLENGGSVICTYLEKAAKQVTTYTDENGKTGRQYISEVVAHLLNEKHFDSVAAKITKCLHDSSHH